MNEEGFAPEIPASERPQTHSLDRANTGIGKVEACGTETFLAQCCNCQKFVISEPNLSTPLVVCGAEAVICIENVHRKRKKVKMRVQQL